MIHCFRCPVCHAVLAEEDRRFVCGAGHSFDRASHGWVNLLTRQNKGGHGDNREMLIARRNFLDRGYYAPLSYRLSSCVSDLMRQQGITAPLVVDAGCGEGYYSACLSGALEQQGMTPSVVGLDISREALRLAHQRLPHAKLAVGGLYDMPVADEVADVLLCFFAPLVPQEFARVLKKEGLLCMAVPGPRHLFALKEVLYTTPYENDLRDTELSGFYLQKEEAVRTTICVDRQEDIHALFAMTPYYYRTPRAGHSRVEALKTLTTEIDFRLLIYRKK